jgi:mono/diheme cytochrome c family protein
MRAEIFSRGKRAIANVLAVGALLVVAGCGGGGGGGTGDVKPSDPIPPAPTAEGPNAYLLFPNPQVQSDSSRQTDTLEYAEAYYRAVDPQNERDTLEKYKAKNGFGNASTGQEITVVFGDVRDLGYGRLMNVRRNNDGTLAFFVQNYLVGPAQGYTYSRVNLDAAVLKDNRWWIGTNAIEFSPGPNGGVPFLKFYNYSSADNKRALLVNLDNRGMKAMPGPCITCHGGRGDALTPPGADGKRLFPLVANSASQTRGDVQAHFHEFDVASFDFSDVTGFTRAEQEAKIKTINQWILCTYPIAAGETRFAEDQCRRQATPDEWQGTGAARNIKEAYGGNGMPRATFSDTFIPDSWVAAGQSTLYREVIANNCRVCHALRGTGNQSDIDFGTYEKFSTYPDRVKAHIVNRGNMPLAKLVYDRFYETQAPEAVATFLTTMGETARDAQGRVLRPGRPIADAGPDRVVRPGNISLSASMSLFATAYQWSIVSGPAGATLNNANTATPTLVASTAGSYVIQLIATSGSVQSSPARLNIRVDSALPYDPNAVRFADIKQILQSPTAGCTNSGCHSGGGTHKAPVIYADIDRNGDGQINATDDEWLYAEVRSRVNLTDFVASALLRKPSGRNHNGAQRPGFNNSLPVGESGRASYDTFTNWVVNGAPR